MDKIGRVPENLGKKFCEFSPVATETYVKKPPQKSETTAQDLQT